MGDADRVPRLRHHRWRSRRRATRTSAAPTTSSARPRCASGSSTSPAAAPSTSRASATRPRSRCSTPKVIDNEGDVFDLDADKLLHDRRCSPAPPKKAEGERRRALGQRPAAARQPRPGEGRAAVAGAGRAVDPPRRPDRGAGAGPGVRVDGGDPRRHRGAARRGRGRRPDHRRGGASSSGSPSTGTAPSSTSGRPPASPWRTSATSRSRAPSRG